MTVILPQSKMTDPIFLRGFEMKSQKANPCQIATWSIILAIICGYSRLFHLTIDLLAECCRLAGSDTTGISLRAIVYYLVQNPVAYQKLQREVDQADQAGKLSEFITYAECLELDYL